MSLTNYSRQKMVDYFFGNIPFSINTYYLALSKTPIGLDGTFTEADYQGYARVAITNNKTSFSDYNPSNNTVSNRSAIFFPTCTGGSSTVVAVALMDSANGGNVILRGTVQLVKTYEFGDRPVYEVGMLTFSFE